MMKRLYLRIRKSVLKRYKRVPKPHYVRDYERLVQKLVAKYPIDQAMSLAVGGDYENTGNKLRDLMVSEGLVDNSKLVDVGCGSGRLATAIFHRGPDIDYLGIDIVQQLLDYAKLKTGPRYHYIRQWSLTMPVENSSVDFISAFSLFTHLHHHETFKYLQAMAQSLRPGGKIIFSFLEFENPEHWASFLNNYGGTHLNAFIERNVIQIWADKLALKLDHFTEADVIGQVVAVLHRP